MIRCGKQRLHEVRQQPEALDDYTRLVWQSKKVFDRNGASSGVVRRA
ncbi:hypothetical protein [Streptomyces sp. NL15-2K]|nr:MULTISPECIES: hypothetical protein [Actinomycetes]WKX10919.1 hypothetical protein Q4V64_26800 [Kutzneria buriramensis]GCB47516.1 hypothetical protein SNL152K_4822 [Streptomyces sp. NL15-2K]